MIKSGNKRERGQSLVEFSISLIALVFIIGGLVDLGRTYFIFIALEDSAGDAALFLSLDPDCPDNAACTDPGNAEWRAENAASGFFDFTTADTTVTSIIPSPWGAGSVVTVEIRHTFALLTPVIPQIIGVNTLTLKSTATQTIVSE